MSMRDFQHKKDRFTASRGHPHVRTNRQGKVLKTYTPLPGYWKAATCKDLRCHEYENGWVATIPANPDPAIVGQARAAVVTQMLADVYRMRNNGTWTFTEERVEGLSGEVLIRFTFPPGLTCFRHLNGTGHKVPVQRNPVFLHRPAGRPGQTRRLEEDQFFDEFNESAHKSQRMLEKG